MVSTHFIQQNNENNKLQNYVVSEYFVRTNNKMATKIVKNTATDKQTVVRRVRRRIRTESQIYQGPFHLGDI